MIPPLVSVVVPFYNHREFIVPACERMGEQTFDDWELLLVDNNSIDGSRELALQQEAKHAGRVRYVHAPRQGIPQARNQGLEQVRGRYVSFLDIDDHFTPDKLAIQAPVLESNPDVAMVYGLTRRMYLSDQRVVIQDRGAAVEGRNAPPELAIDWMGSFFRLPQTGATLVRTAVAREIGGFNEDLALGNDDVGYHLKLAFRHPVWFVNREAVVYYRHAKSAGAELNRNRSVEMRYYEAYSWAVRQAADYERRTRDARPRQVAERALLSNLIEAVAALPKPERNARLDELLKREQADGFLRATPHKLSLMARRFLPRRLGKQVSRAVYRLCWSADGSSARAAEAGSRP